VNRRQLREINWTSGSINGDPHPFLKWAGGKRQLLSQLSQYLPAEIPDYIEPFLGGGAMFFYLLPDKAVLIDNNPVLINTYSVIKNQVDDLIELLKHHKNEKEYYYGVRNLDREPGYEKLSNVEKASRTIYLNRCCFNGLYRVNSKGQFNVPFGKYKNPKYCDENNLRAVSEVLQNVTIIAGSFEKCVQYAKPETFVYLDPPYHPLTSTANFTSYTKESFGERDQRRLRKVFTELDEKKCKVMLSNSHADFILDLYSAYRIETVQAKRAINRDASKRGVIPEVVVLNY
jgi:DNA adenine methylase